MQLRRAKLLQKHLRQPGQGGKRRGAAAAGAVCARPRSAMSGGRLQATPSSPGGCLLGSRDCGASHLHTAVEDTPRTNADCHLAPGFCDIQTCMRGTKQ